MRRVLCLHLPYLSTDLLRCDNAIAPADARRPLVLVERVNQSQVVARRCPRARAGGIEAGVSLGQAQATVPQLMALPFDPARDRQQLRGLANWALRFSPTVQPYEPDCVLVDITGCKQLFGGEENIAHQAYHGLAHRGFSARVAIADTVGAAYALATTGPSETTVVSAGQISAHLAPLPPAALRLDDGTLEKLLTLGIRTIGGLLDLPRASLPARFGQGLVKRLRQALGETIEPLVAQPYKPLPATRLSFEAPITDARPLPALARQMLDEIADQLQRCGLGVQCLELVVYHEHAPPVTLRVNLSRPSRAWQHIDELIRGRIESSDLGSGITGLLLLARRTARWQPGQGDLFEYHDPRADEDLGCLIDRLANRLGPDAVVRPQLVDDHQPEFSFNYVPVSVAGCKARDDSAEDGAADTPPEISEKTAVTAPDDPENRHCTEGTPSVRGLVGGLFLKPTSHLRFRPQPSERVEYPRRFTTAGRPPASRPAAGDR